MPLHREITMPGFRFCPFVLVVVAVISLGAAPNGSSAHAKQGATSRDEIELVEHSSEIFIGTIDIVTAVNSDEGGNGPDLNTEYTVLVSDVLKGRLKPQSIIVIRQDGGVIADRSSFHDGDGPLIPGSEYLFFARFVPGLAAYPISEPIVGNLPITSSDQRSALIGHWSRLVEQTTCPYTDVLKLNGVVYARRDWNEDKRYLEREWVGPTVATVEVQETTATGCRVEMVDRSASVIPAGTKVQELQGYETAFRVAVRMPDRHRYLYEAIWSENARTGADLLDIRDRATGLEVERWLECDDAADCVSDVHTVSDPVRIDRVTDWVLDAPADPDGVEWRQIPSNWLRLTFTLDDASTLTLWIDRESGRSQSGIRLPVDELVEYLWAN
jgi:hypothetical protein